jgi:hypothetical protein
MNLPKLKSRLGRTALVLGLTGGMLGGVGIAAAQAAGVGSLPGDVSLSPASGPISSTSPTWATTVGCKTGFQGSAVFKAITPSGATFSISPGVANVTNGFNGTLNLTLSQIQTLSGVPAGGSQELVVYCFSGGSLTGTSDPEMSTFITWNADGTYSTSSSNPVPIGEIGGMVFAGLAAIGLVWMQLRRRSRRTRPSLT